MSPCFKLLFFQQAVGLTQEDKVGSFGGNGIHPFKFCYNYTFLEKAGIAVSYVHVIKVHASNIIHKNFMICIQMHDYYMYLHKELEYFKLIP